MYDKVPIMSNAISTTLQPLSGDSVMPLHHQLSRFIQEALARQQWRPGDRLPSEEEIARQVGVAIGTVRHALSSLVRKGILVRHQGKGTFVKRPSFDSSLFRFWRFYDAEEGKRTLPESRILQIRKATVPANVREDLQLSKNESAIFISRVRLREGKPIVAEEIWLPYRRFSSLLDMSVDKFGPLLYPLYEQVCGQYVARAEERLTARVASAKQARLLNTNRGITLIVINRLARGFDDSPLEWRISWGCADLFQYQIEVR